jgi:predicted ArsR family transcriptional regulator
MHAQNNAERLLYLIKTQGPQTAATLGELLDMSAVGARGHLRKLEARGLVSSFERRERVGRPRQYWQLTERGQGEFPDRHSDLSLALIDGIRELFGEGSLEQLVRQRERDTLLDYRAALSDCRDLGSRIARLAELRSAEGYMARAEPIDNGDAWLLVENHCPICAAARRCQGFCQAELDLFRELLNAEVERTEHIVEGARRCAYRISPA